MIAPKYNMTTRVILPIALLATTVLASRFWDSVDTTGHGSKRHRLVEDRLKPLTHDQDAYPSRFAPDGDRRPVLEGKVSYTSDKPEETCCDGVGFCSVHNPQVAPEPKLIYDPPVMIPVPVIDHGTGYLTRKFNCVNCKKEYSTNGNPSCLGTFTNGKLTCLSCSMVPLPSPVIDPKPIVNLCIKCNERMPKTGKCTSSRCNKPYPQLPPAVVPQPEYIHGNVMPLEKNPDWYKPWLKCRTKWGIYARETEQEYLLQQVRKVDENNLEEGIPCLTRNGNSREDIRKRYLVRNSEGQHVYLVKTFGGTGNRHYFGTDGDKREKHNENTLGEFKKNGLWYTVYWRCQKTNHKGCSHDYKYGSD